MNIDPKFVSEVERLRKAAKENEVVLELLYLITKSILIDDNGNKEIIADKDVLRSLEACQVASVFADYDIDQND